MKKRCAQQPAAVAALALALLLGLNGYGKAQSGEWPVTLIMRDGTHIPFTITEFDHARERALGYIYETHGLPQVWYSAGEAVPPAQFQAEVGGATTLIPIIEQIIRVDLVEPGEQTIWRATLKDGRFAVGAIDRSENALFWLVGVNQFGASETLKSYPRDPDRQPFIGIIFDPDAIAPGEATAQQAAARVNVDTITLRNGDVLSGSILTGEFTVQASYGTLTFSSEQLASIAIEDAAGRTDQFVLTVGDRVSGVLQNTTIEMALTTGATITLEKGNIASTTFATED